MRGADHCFAAFQAHVEALALAPKKGCRGTSNAKRSVVANVAAARAKAVAAALIKRGIAGQRLQTAGLGPTQPKGDNSTLQGRALNRRVELVRTDR